MLKLLRNRKTAKKIWIGLGIIIIPAFVFWGFGGAMRDKNEKGYIGKIDGQKISVSEFKDSLSAVRNAAILQYGAANLPEIEKILNFEAEAWQRLALLEVAKKSKIKASDQEVIKQVQSYPLFMRQGKFDIQTYNNSLKYDFHTQARAFEEQIRQKIIISKLYRKITDGITVGDKEVREEYLKTKSIDNPKFKIDEKKFLSEKKEFEEITLEKKKLKHFSDFMAELLK